MMHEADAFKFDSLGSATCGRALSCTIVVAFHLTNAGKKSLQFWCLTWASWMISSLPWSFCQYSPDCVEIIVCDPPTSHSSLLLVGLGLLAVFLGFISIWLLRWMSSVIEKDTNKDRYFEQTKIRLNYSTFSAFHSICCLPWHSNYVHMLRVIFNAGICFHKSHQFIIFNWRRTSVALPISETKVTTMALFKPTLQSEFEDTSVSPNFICTLRHLWCSLFD